MGDVALRVENLSKQYRIGKAQARYSTLRDSLMEMALSPVRRAANLIRGNGSGAADLEETIWALKDVSFEVKKGEVVGIIGRNGAGKTTLLKILSRITEPTEGCVDIFGRVGSLLEVGTGFHPELTGRENIYLNGAILGMKKAEIERKFDEIVAFAEIEKFIDTPVKFYSSGMYVRLAFAVAAHLEPEILMVDEVLSVGDAAFQKKCLGKMGEVAEEGRTVLFVSHNMAAVDSLCKRIFVLDEGKSIFDGDSNSGIAFYTKENRKSKNNTKLKDYPRSSPYRSLINSYRIMDETDNDRNLFPIGSTVVIELELYSDECLSDPHISIGVNNSIGVRVFTASTRFQKNQIGVIHGQSRVRCILPYLNLAPDQYLLKVCVGDSYSDFDCLEDLDGFEIIANDYLDTGKLPYRTQGILIQNAEWSSVRTDQ